MKTTAFDNFKKQANVFNETSARQKEGLLNQCANEKAKSANTIQHYHDALLFTLAYPESKSIRDLAEAEMIRLTTQIETSPQHLKDKLILSGIANTQTDGAFSLSLIKWLLQQYGTAVSIHSFDPDATHPKDVLKYVFPEMEFEILADEKLNARQWIAKVSGTKNKHLQLKWLVEQVDGLKISSLLKDQLFESLSVYVTVHGKQAAFSRSFGNTGLTNLYCHETGILKKFDEQQLINKKLPAPKKLSFEQKWTVINSARTALALLNRETDPVTYCNDEGLLFYELEHGLSIALFSMLPERRLPIESYIGFMMFKNGYPMAYGGGWLFGHRSLLGINIFEAFRGGESAFVFAQLLRTYKQAFGAEYFEVEPYQFGKNNPEGLQSGAFWFYYRFGFRPIESQLHELALKEAELIGSQKGYRSSIDTLKKFTAGNVSVNYGKQAAPLNPSLISKFITQEIALKHHGDRLGVESKSKKHIAKLLKLNPAFMRKNATGINKLAVFITLCIDEKKVNAELKKQLVKLIETKSNSEFEYINCLQKTNLKKALGKTCLDFISC